MDEYSPNKSEDSQSQTSDNQPPAGEGAGPGGCEQVAQPEGQGAGPAEAGEAVGVLDKDTRLWGMLCHLAGLLGWIGPLVIWLIKREDHPFIDAQGKAALNFQISIMIYAFAASLLVLAIIGFILLPAIGIFNLIMIVMASMKANEGQSYRYPLSFQFIK